METAMTPADVMSSGIDRGEEPMLDIEILGTACPACDQLEANVREALCELGVEARVEHISPWWSAVSYGVFAIPGLAINKHVKAQGCVPPKEAIVGWIQAALRGEPEAPVVCEACEVRRKT
jgi:small redox-active disulfide protein 2